jgi:hypothetical protein
MRQQEAKKRYLARLNGAERYRVRMAENRGSQTTDLRVGGSNPSGRASLSITYASKTTLYDVRSLQKSPTYFRLASLDSIGQAQTGSIGSSRSIRSVPYSTPPRALGNRVGVEHQPGGHVGRPSTHGPRHCPPRRCSGMPSDAIAASSWRTASTSGGRTTDVAVSSSDSGPDGCLPSRVSGP